MFVKNILKKILYIIFSTKDNINYILQMKKKRNLELKKCFCMYDVLLMIK